MAVVGIIIEKTMLCWLYKLDHLYGLLLRFGLSLILEGLFRQQFGVSGQPYQVPDLLKGATDLGFMILPNYRAWVVVASLGGWVTVITGVIFVICVLAFRRGVVGEIAARIK